MNEVKAWLKRKTEADEVIRIVRTYEGTVTSFALLRAYDYGAPGFGRILFDAQKYWIYDGDNLSIAEQEQMAAFILKSFFDNANLQSDE